MPLPTLGAGVYRQIALATEATFGTAGAGPGTLLRRANADLNLDITPITSPEILSTQQVRDVRNGPRRVRSTYSTVLVPGAFKDFFDNLLRGTWTAGVVKASVTDVAGSPSGLGNQTLTSASVGAWITSGFKRGDIIRPTGFTGAPAALNGTNYRVSSVTPTVMIINPMAGQAVLSFSASTQSPTITVVGKKLTIPQTGHTKRSFSLESWFGDLNVSHLYLGNRMQQIALNFPAAGMVQLQASMLGLDMVKSGSRTYATPNAASVNTALTMVSGKIAYAGGELAYVTGASIQIAANLGAEPVIGSPTAPEIFQGTIMVRGSVTVFMSDDPVSADFLAEAEVDISIVATTSPAANADFVSIFLGRVKLTTSTMQDGDTGMVRTFNFQGLEMVSGGSGTQWDATSIVIQDSLA